MLRAIQKMKLIGKASTASLAFSLGRTAARKATAAMARIKAPTSTRGTARLRISQWFLCAEHKGAMIHVRFSPPIPDSLNSFCLEEVAGAPQRRQTGGK